MSLKTIITLSFCTILISISSLTSFAQIAEQSIQIEKLSDQQIQALFNEAQKAGYNLENIDQFARQRGLTPSNISALKTRITQLRVEPQNNSPQLNQAGIQATNLTPVPPSLPSRSTIPDNIFGSSLFNNPSLTFSPNLNIPTPQNYILGPGDQINIELWGKTELSTSLTVSPDGHIIPSNLGPIYVNGLTIEEARTILIKQLDRIYDGLIPNEGENATVFSLITLGQIRSISVTVVGESRAPGNYTLNSLSTVYSALYASGGPNSIGSFRKIQLIRNNKLFKEIDVYTFLIDGIKQGDETLRDGDILLIKPYEKRVTINGQVKRSGQFEIKNGETIANALTYAGGLSGNFTGPLITIERTGDTGKRLYDLTYSEISSFELENGDIIRFRSPNAKFLNRVVIEGAVLNSGQYELTSDMTLKALIDKAGGLRGDAYLDKVLVYRMKDNFEQEVVSYSLEEIMDSSVNIILRAEDIVEVKSIFSITEEPYIRITGQVPNAGVYPYLENITPYELIMLAGGMRADANPIIEVSRIKETANNSFENEIIQLDLSSPNSQTFRLLPFDRIYVRSKPGYLINQEVRVSGEVNSPGLFSISKNNERISDVISRAGGVTEYAYPKGALLIRKNELENTVSGFVIDREAINDLRQKIFENTGLSRNSRTELTDRIEQITSEQYSGLSSTAVTNVRKDLLALAKQANDSTGPLLLNQYEPVAIDLHKILSDPESEGNLYLRAGDIISIPPQLQTVRVSGEVISSINLNFESNKSFKQYINESGGYIRSANRGRSYVQYPNGERAKVKRFLFFKSYPKIEPGSTIVVARKKERAPLNFGTIVTSTGSLLSLVLIIDRLSNN